MHKEHRRPEITENYWMTKKDKKIPVKTASRNAITQGYFTPTTSKTDTLEEVGAGTTEKETKVSTGLAKRDKERTHKIVEKYKKWPNMEATKKKCVLRCPEQYQFLGSLRFCDLLFSGALIFFLHHTLARNNKNKSTPPRHLTKPSNNTASHVIF